MDKPTPPKTITTRMLGTGPAVEFVLLTDAIAHGEAMAAWGAAQYKEDAERYAFAKTLEGQVVTMEAFKNLGASALDDALNNAMAEDAAIDKARGK